MNSDVPEIAPPAALTPNKAATPEVIGDDVEKFELQSGVDTKNKGKAIDLGSSIGNIIESSPISKSVIDSDSLIAEDEYDYDYDYSDEYESEEEEETDDCSMYQALFDSKDIPSGVEVTMDLFSNLTVKETDKSVGSTKSAATGSNTKEATNESGIQSQDAPVPDYDYSDEDESEEEEEEEETIVEEVISAPDDSRVKRKVEDFLGSYLFFKRFDMVEDFSDHYYASKGTASKQHSKVWAKRIQEEWRMLEKDLPEMIFVRAYESRMDLLRAVIIGAEGTPYHDGLFFFDIFFSDQYPYGPPTVHYHSGGLRINPNLYNSGKVCLSLLGTWRGTTQKEEWIPNDSTMLQVLVSIQGLILNQKPYFNEPGFESSAGSLDGESRSKAYSENVFLLSMKTMVYNMRRPPKYFEEFVYGHFFSYAHELLKTCDAYRNGAAVGSVVKGSVEDVKETSSEKFRKDVATFWDTVLLKELILLGILGLDGKPCKPWNICPQTCVARK